jgi:hypothetical protein
MLSSQRLLDAAGRRRSPANTPGFRAGIAPGNKGQSYPADPPTVDEIVAVMRQAGDNRHGHRVTALIAEGCGGTTFSSVMASDLAHVADVDAADSGFGH